MNSSVYNKYCIAFVFLFAVALGNQLSKSSVGKLRLTIAYCPSYFSGKGAVVEVNPTNGNWTVIGTFDLPSSVIGCPLEEDTTITLDPSTSTLYIYWTDELQLSLLDLNSASIIQTSSTGDDFFTGFENMAWSDVDDLLYGVSGTVTQDGYCFDGCFQFGAMTSDASYNSLQNIPFKAVMDDSHFYDSSNEIFWIQASYDLRDPSQWCAPSDSDLCILSIDAKTGDLKTSTYTNYTIYKYGKSQDQNGQMLVWMEWYQACKVPYESFLFAKVDLATAQATPVACIPSNVVVDEDEWIASFSLDGSLFATGSGDAESGIPQLLVFDTTTAQLVLNSTLPGLGKYLNTADGLFDIWSVDFI